MVKALPPFLSCSFAVSVNSIIRSIVYDPNRYTNNSNNLLTNVSETSKTSQVKNSKSSKKLEIMDVEQNISSNQIVLIDDKPIKKTSVKKTKEENKNNMALVISK